MSNAPMTAPAWDPSMPLRADATDADIDHGRLWLFTRREIARHEVFVAREFAAACVQGRRCPVCHNDE